MRNAFADAYKANRVAVASMGNDYGQVTNYPAALGQGIIAVGATTNTNTLADYSTTGSWIDMAAPGGGGFGSQNENGDFIFTTIPSSGYSNFLSGSGVQGTSYSAPVVSGIAALLLSYNSGLYNDDIEQIIRFGTVDLGAPGFDNSFGTGRVDARKALDFLRAPYSFSQLTATNGTVVSTSNTFQMTFYSTPGLADGTYIVKRYVIQKAVTFSSAYCPAPYVWGRGVASTGYNYGNPNFGMSFCQTVAGTITPTSATLETVVYEVWNLGGGYLGFKPTTPANAVFAYTVLGISQPPSVTITGPSSLPWKQQGTWTANPSGGNCSFTYEWRYRYSCGTGNWSGVVGTSQTYTSAMPNSDFELQVKVTSNGQIAYDTHCVTLGPIKAAHPNTSVAVPEKFVLLQNFPNPFNPETEIRFGLPEDTHVRLMISDLLGREVRNLLDSNFEAGYRSVVWDGKDNAGNQVPSGIYIYQIVAGDFREQRKLTLVR